ncbi:dihydrodipicolinate synthase family protein [Aestuariirhabdus sp. Z084]|uniref:dihydrodipicolinate synthase family protein n=1 Tax=Aestuariirhabdus haliotis TaxID=2918751 RepID=UPI00201B3DD4|nr:dihydrodipicolinate synthase family protein [Aestuariirhabdus haliotis]MCL6415103.1 dihydrodipicolinate synthase family protein [Aestuariirhabdus haliotis]MCL6419035.1 dihydrodipicolinate synthase family protein [Aestuariirhabdus haliotis]
MKTSPVTTDDLQRSVLSVPPLCRNEDLTINRDANKVLIRHLEEAGVSTFMYGGNANFYHVSMGEYPYILDFLSSAVSKDSWVIPAVGPDYGKLMDQAKVLAQRDFPTAMVLPQVFPKSPRGVEEGIRRFVDAMGKPAIAYIKIDGYLEPDQVARLVDDKVVCAIKYARVLDDPDHPVDDPYLTELCKLIDSDLIISGIGERPVITHWNDFGLRAFTSGSVCVAPHASAELLKALQAGDLDKARELRKLFIPLEDMRDQYSPLCVLHRAVELANIADTGVLTPLLSEVVEGESKNRLEQVAKALYKLDSELSSVA